MTIQKLFTCLMATVAVLALSNLALAVPTPMIHFDTPGDCDPLFIPQNVHEIGDFSEFPSNEALSSADLGFVPNSPCPMMDDMLIPNVLIDIRNLSGIDWYEVWYVADPETTITNFDGEANQGIPGAAPVHEAFRIDNMISDPTGMHHPLVSESILADGIWQAGESWTFILQDYTNTLGLPPEALTSIGVGSFSTPPTGVDPFGIPLGPSSGSIIAITIPVPEPGTLILSGIGLLGIFLHRRNK